jgi:hypothetical protein
MARTTARHTGEQRSALANTGWCQLIARLAASHEPQADEDWQKTERLKADLQSWLGHNPDRGLTIPLFDRIIDWKLRGQRGRTEHHRIKIDENMLQAITACAFQLNHSDRQCLAAVRLQILSSLPGIGYGVASATMSLVFPKQYGVIDFRVWRVIFSEERNSFTVGDYLKYLEAIWECSYKLGWEPQKVDYFTWIAYKHQSSRKRLRKR